MFLVRDPKSKIVTHNGTFGEDGIFGDFEGTAYLSGYLALNFTARLIELGTMILGVTLWWQGFSAGCVDFTNEKAADWWTDRLNRLRYNSSFIALILGTNESLCLFFT